MAYIVPRAHFVILTLFFTIACMATAVAPAAFAQIAEPRSVCVANCSGSQPSSAPFVPGDKSRQRKLKNKRDMESSSDEGTDYLNRGDWNNAIRSFEEALDHEPDNEDVAKKLEQARTGKAQASALAVTTASPGPVAAPTPGADAATQDQIQTRLLAADSFARGSDAYTREDWTHAVILFHDAVVKQPSNPSYRKMLTLAVGEFNESRAKALEASLRVHNGRAPLPKAWSDLIDSVYRDATPGVLPRVRNGFEAVQRNDWKNARDYFVSAQRIEPNNTGLKGLIAAVDYGRPARAPNHASDQDYVQFRGMPPENPKPPTLRERADAFVDAVVSAMLPH